MDLRMRTKRRSRQPASRHHRALPIFVVAALLFGPFRTSAGDELAQTELVLKAIENSKSARDLEEWSSILWKIRRPVLAELYTREGVGGEAELWRRDKSIYEFAEDPHAVQLRRPALRDLYSRRSPGEIRLSSHFLRELVRVETELRAVEDRGIRTALHRERATYQTMLLHLREVAPPREVLEKALSVSSEASAYLRPVLKELDRMDQKLSEGPLDFSGDEARLLLSERAWRIQQARAVVNRLSAADNSIKCTLTVTVTDGKDEQKQHEVWYVPYGLRRSEPAYRRFGDLSSPTSNGNMNAGIYELWTKKGKRTSSRTRFELDEAKETLTIVVPSPAAPQEPK